MNVNKIIAIDKGNCFQYILYYIHKRCTKNEKLWVHRHLDIRETDYANTFQI